MHYYQHNIKDFNNATRHLTRVERALYRDAIELYYDNEHPLTSDISLLKRRLIIVSNDEIEALTYILNEFFYLDGDLFRNNRCDEEIDKYHNNNSLKAKAGKASAEARRKKKRTLKTKKSTDVEQVLNTCTTEAQQNSTNKEPLTINQEPLTKNHNKTPLSDDDKSPREIEIDLIFKYWQEIWKHPQSKLDAKRKSIINNVLKTGYSVDNCKLAILGCSLTPHNQGKNDRNQKFDGLHIIYDSKNIDRFITNAGEPPKPPSGNQINFDSITYESKGEL